jgi:hypothetical protein
MSQTSLVKQASENVRPVPDFLISDFPDFRPRFPGFLVELMLCSLVVGDLVKGSTGETQKAVEMFRHTSKKRLLWGAR